MTTVLGANTLSSGGYEVGNSLRENRADSAFLYKTFDDDGTHHDKGTISVWVKRSQLGAEAMIYSAGASGREFIRFETNDTLTYRSLASSFHLNTNAVFRDPSAWYHIVVAFDSSQGTASNRQKIYVNGVQETSFATETYQPNQNTDHKILSGELQRLGRDSEQANPFANCYFCEVVGIDGVAHDPTSFGEFDSDSGIWKPIKVSGLTFGTNGFHLNFADSSALGTDVSGNSNTFANTNFATTDQSTDTCTNNFATLNPLIFESSGITFAEGALKVTSTGSDSWVTHYGLSTIAVSTGKWFVEAKMTTKASAHAILGLISTSQAIGSSLKDNGVAAVEKTGRITGGGNNIQTGLTEWSNGEIAGAAFDADNGTVQFYRQGSAYGNAVSSIASDTYYFAVNMYQANGVTEFNFGSPPYSESGGNSDADGHGNFSMAVPNGYFALCTKNLAEYG